MTARAFNAADYYDCDQEAETYHHRDVEEALDALLDSSVLEGESRAETARRVAPVTVYAVRRVRVPPSWLGWAAGQAERDLVDRWIEEFGGGDGPAPTCTRAQGRALRAAGAECVASWVPWRCEEVARRSYSAAEILKLLGAST